MPNDDNTVTKGKKAPKYRTIELFSIVEGLEPEIFTASGWPSVSGDALRILALKIHSLWAVQFLTDSVFILHYSHYLCFV